MLVRERAGVRARIYAHMILCMVFKYIFGVK